ncbi:MAG: hypothetical protein DSM106950_11590 [Stigonema ocellatum SAG 48.90 = DSM 106950]|nr:hypothetical protein [Stigonema ocellatum SAG 48.90 = DSM 106950]
MDAEGQTHVNDVFAGTIRQQLISLQDDPQRLEQAAQLMNDDALNAVIASGISTSMRIVSYSSSEITHDTSNAERLLDVIDKIGSLDFRARAFVQGGNILATFSGDVGFPHLAQGTVSADHAEGLGQRLYEMLNKDTYDLISKIYNKDRFSGALSAVLRVPLEKANQGDALSIQSLAQSTVKLQGHFTETGPDEFGRIYRKGVQSLAYFMGAMGAAADSLTSDEEKKLALAASIFTFTTALAAGGAGPYLLGARAIASNTATAGIGFVPGQLVIKYANEYKESIGNTRRLFAKMALPEGLQGDDVNAYLITADQARTRSAQ